MTLVLLSIPDFLLATMLMIVFVIMTPLFPAISLVDQSSSAGEYLYAMTLPAVTLAIVMAVYAVRMLRDNLIEVLDSDYIRMAELKGVPNRRVVWRHALPNALVPTLNVTALNLAYLIGGVVIVERVFSYPGFGSLLVDALQLRDLPLIEATVMIAAAVYIAREPHRGYRRDPAQPASSDGLSDGRSRACPSRPPPGASLAERRSAFASARSSFSSILRSR